MKDKFLKHKKLIIPLLILALVLPLLFFNRNQEPPLPPATEVNEAEGPEKAEEPLEEEEEEAKENKDPEERPEPGPEPDPEPKPDLAQEPDPKPAPAPKPEPNPESKPEAEAKPDSTPIIYVGQQLRIPGNFSTGPSGPSKLVNQGSLSSSSKQIALTFDAGWIYEPTIDLLDTLDRYNVKSTFFLRAQWAKDHPQLAREIMRRGHSVENHSLTHGHMREMSDSQVRSEIVQATNIIKDITGYRSYLFRPPYGEYDNRILRILGEEGYTHTIMWTIDTHDWAEELNGTKVTKQYLINRVLNNASNNGIALMHVGGHYTVDALPEIITGLRNAGYKLVKVNDMLPKPASSSTSELVYTVEKGDTLYSISQKYGVTVEDIIVENNL